MKNRIEIRQEKIIMRDVEIEIYKDFDQLLNKRDKILLQRRKYFWSAVFGTTIIIALLIYNGFQKDQSPNEEMLKPVHEQVQNNIPNGVEFTDEKTDSLVSSNVHQKDKEQKKVTGSAQPSDSPESTIVPKPKKLLESTRDSSKAISYKYEEAYPLDGMPALYAYFEEQLRYPEEALQDSTEGTVFIRFKITTEGKPKDIEVEQSIGQLFDSEAIRLIENMPEWKPANVNGTPITSAIRIPIHFNIKKEDKDEK